MNRLGLAIVYTNIFGLAVSQALESWRWGTISAVLPQSWIWLCSLVLLGLAIIFRDQPERS